MPNHRVYSDGNIDLKAAKPKLPETTRQGLTVTAAKDTNCYPTGIKVSDEDLASLSIKREPFRGDLNYTIQPQ